MTQLNKLGFKNHKLLTTALTHRSAINEKQGIISNERLEFLGDAVLELTVSDYLYQRYPNAPEGQLTHLRSQIVQTKTLAAAARKLNLGQVLILSKGERKAAGQKNPSILANAFEALIGALYLDQGLTAVKNFIRQYLVKPLGQLLTTAQVTDFKSQLQEAWQKRFHLSPRYRLVKTSGPDHHKTFVVRVYLKDKSMGQGSGPSKQAAEQQAAQIALGKKNKL